MENLFMRLLRALGHGIRACWVPQEYPEELGIENKKSTTASSVPEPPPWTPKK